MKELKHDWAPNAVRGACVCAFEPKGVDDLAEECAFLDDVLRVRAESKCQQTAKGGAKCYRRRLL